MIDAILAVKFVHVLFAAVLFGAWLCVAAFMVFAHRSRNASVIALIAQFSVRIELFIVAPAFVVQPVSGFPLGNLIGLSGADDFWVGGSTVVYAVVLLAWLGALRLEFLIRRMARQASLGGVKLDKRYSLLFRIWAALAALIFTGMVLIFLLMVWQPRLN
jgi:uncharacterized membrane protein